MSKRPAPPSAHDVARLAGVSQAAVSRAFTPGASIARATKDRILESAAALGYRPNLLARSLITGKSGIIGIVFGHLRTPIFLTILDRLSAHLSKAGNHMLVYTADGDTTVDILVERLLEFRVDALLLMAATISPELARQCSAMQVPVISFRGPLDELDFFILAAEGRTGSAKIADHMLEQGYRLPALIGGLPENRSSHERHAGFVERIQAEGLPSPPTELGYLRREPAMNAARALLSLDPKPDALFCVSDEMAIAAIEVARFEFGLTIGRELGVAGFDDIEMAAFPSFDLTTYSVPIERVVDRLMNILVDGASESPVHVVIEGDIKIRGSTRRS